MDAAGFDDNPPPCIARQFALLLDKFGKPDAAQEIQRCFDAPATDAEPAESPHRTANSRTGPPPTGKRLDETWKHLSGE